MKSTEEEKMKMVNMAIEEASKILILTMDILEIENFVKGKVVNVPDGREFELKFEITKKLNEVSGAKRIQP